MKYKLFLSSIIGYSLCFLTIYFFFTNFSISFLNSTFTLSAFSLFLLLFLVIWQQKFFSPFFILLKSFASKMIRREAAIIHFSNEQTTGHTYERNIPFLYPSLVFIIPIFVLSITFSFFI